MNDTIIFQHIYTNSGCMLWVDLTFHSTMKYCLKWRYDYELICRNILAKEGVPNGHWAIPTLIKQFLDMGYQNVIYMDADAFIVDQNTDLREACVPNKIGAVWHNLSYLTPDWSHYNAGMLYVTNTPAVNEFVSLWLSKYPGIPDFPWWEQGEFNKLGVSMGIINHLDNRWNAGHVSPSDNKVVWGLHGIPDRFVAMQNAVKQVYPNGV